ncbi:beta-galactosidase [Qingrenia yutianensis]|uniref:Beta-galactosidase n=1 Tax=Qingrenia yutianensis TaxID=2763676 RepID=A0A926F9H3_9FIRM|nr:beta-galactosidase [Qingrenia yutianensis]MBC8596420.1 beta-galactosidase [Qingrenia yutianensis]
MKKRVLAVFLLIMTILNLTPVSLSVFAYSGTDCELKNLNVQSVSKGSEGKTVSISWKNPEKNIRKISLLDIGSDAELTVNDNIDTTASAYVCVNVENLTNGNVYNFKLNVLFDGGIAKSYFINASPSQGTNEAGLSNGKWSMSYARSDGADCYPAVFYSVIVGDDFDGKTAIKAVSNIPKSKTGTYSSLKCAFPSLENGKNYTVKIKYKSGGGTSPEIYGGNSKKLGTLDMNTSSLAEKTFTFTKFANDGIEFLNIVTKSGYDEIITDRISLFESGNEADLLLGYGNLSNFTAEKSGISDFEGYNNNETGVVTYTQPADARGSRIYALDNDGNYVFRSVINRYGAQKINGAKIFGILKNCENNIKITTVNKDFSESDGEFFTLSTDGSKEFDKKISDLKEKLETLDGLMQKCGEKGISADYETVNYKTIEKFIGIMEEDFYKYREFDRANSYYDTLVSLYSESYNSLQSYLSGKAMPKIVPSLTGKDIKIDRNDVVSETETDGYIEENSVFLNGYGHFAYTKNDYADFDGFGANTAAISAKLYDTVTEAVNIKNWNLYHYGAVENFSVSQSGDEKRSGNYSLKITRADKWANEKTFYLRQCVDAEPNTTYVFGLYAKAVNAKGCHFSGHGVIDSNYGLSQRLRRDLSGTYDWKNFEFTYTTGADEHQFEVLIPCENETEALYIDDVYVKRLNSGENLILNPSFEETEETGEFEVYDGHIKSLLSTLDYAYENNIKITLGLGIHYMPKYIFSKYPDTRDENGTYPSYMGYNPTHPKIREMIEIFLNAIIPEIANHPAVCAVSVANEPNFQCFNTSYYKAPWQNWLKEKFSGNIENLNSACGTSYASFDEINFSDAQEYSVLKNLLYRYNDTIMTDYLTHIAQTVRSISPDIKIFAKNLPAIRAQGIKSLSHGIDIESLTGLFDVNGCDAMHYYNHSEYPLMAKTEWYDLLTSVEDLPVFNAEDHLMRDSVTYDGSDIITQTAYADIWQGAVHSRRQSVVWLWDRESDKVTNAYKNANMLMRPQIVANNGKLFLDMQRLANELFALQNAKREAGILYSYNSMTYEPSYLNSVYLAYTNSLFLGEKPLFVTESQTEKLSGLEALIIPEAVSVTDETYAKIKEFAENGGKIFVIGENSLKYNEYLKERNADEILQSAVVIPAYESKTSEKTSVDGLFWPLKTFFESADLYDIAVLNSADGTPAENVEYICADYNGGKIINLCNYSDTEKEVYITDNGAEIEKTLNLISGNETGKYITLLPYTPVMIRYARSSPSMFADRVYGETVISTAPHRMVSGTYKISVSADAEAVLYTAYYKNGALAKIDKTDIEQGFDKDFYIKLDSTKYDGFKAMLWNKNSLYPTVKNAELCAYDSTVVTNVKKIGGMCYVFGNSPNISGNVSLTAFKEDGSLAYIDEVLPDTKGIFKFSFYLGEGEFTIKIKVPKIGIVTVLTD